jgi:hypothetical protein
VHQFSPIATECGRPVESGPLASQKYAGVEQKPMSDVFRDSRRIAMNRSYFDAILVSLIVAGCYMFIAPV